METIEKFKPIKVRIKINQTRDPTKHNTPSIKRKIVLRSGYRNLPKSIQILSYKVSKKEQKNQTMFIDNFLNLISSPYTVIIYLFIILLLISRS